jgi:hypothetical protein
MIVVNNLKKDQVMGGSFTAACGVAGFGADLCFFTGFTRCTGVGCFFLTCVVSVGW